MRLLAPIDFSECSEEVIRQIESRPWPAGTEVRLLHVADTVTLSSGMIDLGPYFELALSEAKKMLQAQASRLADKGLVTSIEAVVGYPASRIPDYAAEWKPDLIMLGSHGRTGLSKFLLGSVAIAVLRKSKESIEIVRKSSHEPARHGLKNGGLRILFATDGSTHSDAAARFAAKQSWPQGSTIEILSVAEEAMPPIDPWVGADDILNRVNHEARLQAQENVTAAEKIFEGSGLQFTGKILAGHAKVVILDEASRWKANLIVVGSHGRQGLARLMVGSVAEAVATNAHCSVAVIRGV